PSPIDPPSGCNFRTRCGHAVDLCAQRAPDWREIVRGHWAACHFAEQFSGEEKAADEKAGATLMGG
ncbi:MAG: peptide ABC transporter ATP-binding protein, partial [Hyphomicrobiales bacterium]|nr:peptide ABC transporter ATP-binding protein [Hyphomicrobiales bacterium]